MRRSLALLVPVLLLAATAPAATAAPGACGGSQHYVDTLTITLPAAPTRTRAGRPVSVPVSVTRTAAPAADVLVYLRLDRGPGTPVLAYGSGLTEVDGRTDLIAQVAHDVRGPLRVTVEAFRPVVEVPCYGSVEEHGLAEAAWGQVTS